MGVDRVVGMALGVAPLLLQDMAMVLDILVSPMKITGMVLDWHQVMAVLMVKVAVEV